MSNLGIFTAGYRWSGSGAVSDWLGGHDGLCRVEGSEAAFGEIRALNYGLRFLVQTAAGRIPCGERLGRWALCPDPRIWKEILGKPLTHGRGRLAGAYVLADALYFSAARFYTIPHVKRYKDMLNAQLGGDFRSYKDYMQMVSDLAGALGDYMSRKRVEKNQTGPEHDESVRIAASRLIAFFYEHLGQDGRTLIFDNAISGLNPELFHLLHPSCFPGQIILLVRRDPRDQFAELVKYSGSTFSWSTGKFIRQYKFNQEKTRRFIEELSDRQDSGQSKTCSRFIRQISFESFVLNRNGTRTRLKDDIQEFWKPFGIRKIDEWKEGHPDAEIVDGANGLFNAERSKANIGIWPESRLTRQMDRISNELAEFIEE